MSDPVTPGNVPVDPPTPATWRMRAWTWVKDLTTSLLPNVGKLFAVGGTLAFLAVALLIWLQWQRFPAEVDADFGQSWNNAVAKLGIEPVYPPQEDIDVGDIYISISPVRDELKDYLPAYPTDAFTGLSVRVAHRDLRASILESQNRPHFADTKFDTSNDVPLVQDRDEEKQATPSDAIALAEVAFPAFEITRSRAASGLFAALGFGRGEATQEKVTISSARTYAAPAYPAIFLLNRFCADTETAGFCEDASARKILSFVFGGERVNATVKDEKGHSHYIFDLKIFIVTRVYLTRSLTVTSNSGDQSLLSLSSAGSAETILADVKVQPSTQQEGQPAVVPGTPGAATEPQGSEEVLRQLRYLDRRYAGLEGDLKFTKPVVFGFRAVTFAIDQLTASEAGPTR